MDLTTYTNFRQNLKSYLDIVYETHEPLVVTRAHGEDVVVLSKKDYQSIMETFYLMRSPKNGQRIFESLEDLNVGGGYDKTRK
ncbi:type II toxin-antitoxin system Phd/YefM family antitoxin [Reichenbachiella versicolor]|uniref:type II toxin-antitoxin system Phd/YefM family antitoxin n=1 Tax=Reichenbachiella versicolor TaxID=1821036 RepID=UPI000D6E421B|nr:type II toxin-antitoxin system prevent-host-death family antitoxin [Reichenbachiella versicolor]